MEENAIVTNEFSPKMVETGSRDSDVARVVQEVQGMIISAKRFPRDQFTSMNRIIEDCQRFGLAMQSSYCYPRGSQTVTGPSIRLAEAIANRWGNLSYGIREISQSDGQSEMQAYCWDLETNTRREINFTVKHERHTKTKKYKLEDPRDIYEMTANQGARRVRSCILAVIPGDVVEKAVECCKKTIAKGDGKKSLKERLVDMTTAFKKIGVPVEAIEKKLGHKMELTTEMELADLIGIGNAIKDNIGSRTKFFDISGGESESQKVSDLNERIGNNGAETKA